MILRLLFQLYICAHAVFDIILFFVLWGTVWKACRMLCQSLGIQGLTNQIQGICTEQFPPVTDWGISIMKEKYRMLNRTKHRDLQWYRNKHIPRKEIICGCRGRHAGNWIKRQSKVQAFSYKSTRDVMYSMINTINTTACCIWMLLRGWT